jgi:hypothetical protein
MNFHPAEAERLSGSNYVHQIADETVSALSTELLARVRSGQGPGQGGH